MAEYTNPYAASGFALLPGVPARLAPGGPGRPWSDWRRRLVRWAKCMGWRLLAVPFLLVLLAWQWADPADARYSALSRDRD